MMKKSACFSPDRSYRYKLERTWQPSLPRCLFVMLNPSTADENVNDNTITRCIDYAVSWGYGGLYIGNLFAWRSTDRKVLKTIQDPIGPLNNQYIADMNEECDITIVAWGTDGVLHNRNAAVLALLDQKEDTPGCFSLQITKEGHPQHPLYLKKNLRPTLYQENQRRVYSDNGK